MSSAKPRKRKEKKTKEQYIDEMLMELEKGLSNIRLNIEKKTGSLNNTLSC